MQNTYTKEELVGIYRGLPEEVRETIFSPETSEAFDQIKEKQALTEEQRELLSVYSGLLMMGVLPPEKYVSTLIEKMQIDREKAASIAQVVNRDIFNPIKDALKRVHDEGRTPDGSSASEPTLHKGTPAVTVTPQSTPERIATNIPEQKTAGSVLSPNWAGTPQNPSDESIPQAHIGSIFEQKLGGAFRLKSDAVQYTEPTDTQIVPPKIAEMEAPQSIPPIEEKNPMSTPLPVDPYRESAII